MTAAAYAYADLVRATVLPNVFLARQAFAGTTLENPTRALWENLSRQPGMLAIKPGMRIAITAGSRGIAEIVPITRTLVHAVKERGAHPFIVPAMGSHGGATVEGQANLLATLGITEENVSCQVLSDMETVEVGALGCGLPVRMDKEAMNADGIIVVNRIKAHSAFRASHESGLVKMLAIGLGNQEGAEACHSLGFGEMGRLIVEMAAVKLAACRVLFGVGLIEDCHDGLADILLFEPEEIIEQEKEALRKAFRNMPRLPLGDDSTLLAEGNLDTLIVDAVGKEYSGSGMDPNITGRYGTPFISGGPAVSRIVALSLTPGSKGNAVGIGRADVIPERVFTAFDRNATYMNAITAAFLSSSAIPLVMPTDKTAIQTAVKTCGKTDGASVRLLRIANTKCLELFYASEAMLPEMKNRPGVSVLEDPRPMTFDAEETLMDAWQ
ncbi:MAG: hypothetical protein DELT_00322 [Desulfovibrio sp.]